MRSSTLFAAFIVASLAILAAFSFTSSTNNQKDDNTMALPYIVVIGGSYVGRYRSLVKSSNSKLMFAIQVSRLRKPWLQRFINAFAYF
jgi:hypothetical protein